LLSDLSAGVFFNDSTKVVAEPSCNQFYYYERKAIAANEKQDVMSTYSLTSFPKELQKKVTLLQHFKSYLEQIYDPAEKEQLIQRNKQNAANKLQYPPGSVYVKKWMRTKHAIMFRLSNKIVQVNFQDHTEILLNSENRYVTYVNKKGQRETMPLNLALDSNNAEMTKRLKYTKDILTHMLNNNQQQTSSQPTSNPISGSRVNTAGGDNAP
jgi:polo-like kinase 1